jgi:hypothetical protein
MDDTSDAPEPGQQRGTSAPKRLLDALGGEVGMQHFLAEVDLRSLETSAGGFREAIIAATWRAREVFGALGDEEGSRAQAEEVEQHLARALLVLTMAAEEEIGDRRRGIAGFGCSGHNDGDR